MTLVRRLNDAGIQRFSEFLNLLRTDTPPPAPMEILTDPLTSEELACQVHIEQRVFANRLEAARYLVEKFHASGIRGIEKDRGLWAWLSLFYFDQLCPPDRHGRRDPKDDLARWVPEVDNYQRYYRHLLAGPYRIYLAHRDDPERALALLCNPVHSQGEIAEQLASRQELVTNKAVVQSATMLYIDTSTKKPKRGAGSKGAGGPRRLAAVLNQLDVTWDLYAMNADGLIQLLPEEFKRFRAEVATTERRVRD